MYDFVRPSMGRLLDSTCSRRSGFFGRIGVGLVAAQIGQSTLPGNSKIYELDIHRTSYLRRVGEPNYEARGLFRLLVSVDSADARLARLASFHTRHLRLVIVRGRCDDGCGTVAGW